MFDALEDRFASIMKKVRGHGTLSEENVKDALRDVRLSLLEADVHFVVVKNFIKKVKERALGKEVQAALTPGQAFVQIVSEELTQMMGPEGVSLDLGQKPPVKILLMGLQGAGKTTSAGKLAQFLKSKKKSVLLVPADVHRPAAIDQLKTLAQQVGVDVHDTQVGASADDVVKSAMAQADRQGQDVVIVDTAGRLQIDPELMEELRDVRDIIEPHYALLVVDAMTGQEAVNVATAFRDQIGIDGLVMTKMDGDARGGAALSVKAVTGAPVMFSGMGEKLAELEPFHPERVAQRILGMGDVLSLIEKTQENFDEKKAKQLAKKVKKAEFSLEDFKDQMKMMQQMGSMKDLMGMLPGMSQAMKKMGANSPDPDRELKRITAIIDSMTLKERRKPDILNGSRRKRIAYGSGTTVQEVNSFLKRFKETKKMMKKLTKGGMGNLKNMMRGMM